MQTLQARRPHAACASTQGIVPVGIDLNETNAIVRLMSMERVLYQRKHESPQLAYDANEKRMQRKLRPEAEDGPRRAPPHTLQVSSRPQDVAIKWGYG